MWSCPKCKGQPALGTIGTTTMPCTSHFNLCAVRTRELCTSPCVLPSPPLHRRHTAQGQGATSARGTPPLPVSAPAPHPPALSTPKTLSSTPAGQVLHWEHSARCVLVAVLLRRLLPCSCGSTWHLAGRVVQPCAWRALISTALGRMLGCSLAAESVRPRHQLPHQLRPMQPHHGAMRIYRFYRQLHDEHGGFWCVHCSTCHMPGGGRADWVWRAGCSLLLGFWVVAARDGGRVRRGCSTQCWAFIRRLTIFIIPSCMMSPYALPLVSTLKHSLSTLPLQPLCAINSPCTANCVCPSDTSSCQSGTCKASFAFPTGEGQPQIVGLGPGTAGYRLADAAAPDVCCSVASPWLQPWFPCSRGFRHFSPLLTPVRRLPGGPPKLRQLPPRQ